MPSPTTVNSLFLTFTSTALAVEARRRRVEHGVEGIPHDRLRGLYNATNESHDPEIIAYLYRERGCSDFSSLSRLPHRTACRGTPSPDPCLCPGSPKPVPSLPTPCRGRPDSAHSPVATTCASRGTVAGPPATGVWNWGLLRERRSVNKTGI